MGVEVCSTSTVGTPYKGRGLSARANRIGKCFLLKKYQSILKAKLPTLQEVPKKSPDVWALCAHRTGNRCPTLGLLMPNAWSLSAHLMGKTDHLMVYDRTAYVILFLKKYLNR